MCVGGDGRADVVGEMGITPSARDSQRCNALHVGVVLSVGGARMKIINYY